MWRAGGCLSVGMPSACHGLGSVVCNYPTMVVCFGMPRGSPAVKLAITVNRDVHARIREAAEAEGSSISAWLTEAARRALLIRDGLAAVAEWEADHGAFTEAEVEDARKRVFRGTSREPVE